MATILSVLSAIFGAIGSAVAWLVKTVNPWVWVGLIVAVTLVGWGYSKGSGGTGLSCSCRDFMCRPRPPRPPRSEQFEVDSVPTGASIIVKTGLAGRRTATVTLSGIAAPAPGEPLAEASRENLERVAGTIIRVETERHGLLRADESLSPEADPVASRGPIVGIAFGESGACLAVEQLYQGFARLLPGAPTAWESAEKDARKNKRGIWK